MPRTKRPTKKTERLYECDEETKDVLKKLDKMAAEHKKKIDDLADMEARNLDLAFKILMKSINKKYLNMTIGQLKNELYLKEKSTTARGPQSARSASHDDGYNTENSSHSSGKHSKHAMGPPSSGSTSRRSRSADTSRRSRSADTSRKPSTKSTNTHRSRSKPVYRTPAYNKNAAMVYPAITPKVTPHTPLTVLRQPRQGEMVVSMTGSPVMVPNFNNMNQDEKANCNIMLTDGTMLSLQPKQLRQSQAYIPFALMDAGVLAQLKTLKDNLDKVVRLGEHTMK